MNGTQGASQHRLHLDGVRLADTAPAFDLTLNPGEINVILGGNRSGKTDLCRFVAGLPSAASGAIRLGEQDLAKLSTRRRSVAYVYQAFVNYPNLTVRDNIGSPQLARGQLDTARVCEIAELLGLDEFLERFPHELSGGQQQRLAIGRALAAEAEVILFDEPLANLDFKLREGLRRELKQLMRGSNTLVLYATSDPTDAWAIADRLILLDAGHLLQSGAPLEVYQNPVSIAAMGLLSEPQINLHDGGSRAVRPEHVRFGDGNRCERLSMQVLDTETSGSETFVKGLVEGQPWVARTIGMLVAERGETIDVFVAQDDWVRF